MIGLLVWLAGAVVLVYEITARHLWPDVIGAALGAGLILWCLGGALLLSARGKGIFAGKTNRTITPEDANRVAEFVRAARERGAPAAK